MMMSKNMLLAASLIFSVVTTALPIGEQEREILYTINELGQDFEDVPLIKQNIDTFIGIFEMHIEIAKTKLTTIDQRTKNTIITNVAALAGVAMANSVAQMAIESLRYMLDVPVRIENISSIVLPVMALAQLPILLSTITGSYIAFNLREAVMAKYNANAALALDKEILRKLIDVKESMIFDMDENLAGSSLLQNVGQA